MITVSSWWTQLLQIRGLFRYFFQLLLSHNAKQVRQKSVPSILNSVQSIQIYTLNSINVTHYWPFDLFIKIAGIFYASRHQQRQFLKFRMGLLFYFWKGRNIHISGQPNFKHCKYIQFVKIVEAFYWFHEKTLLILISWFSIPDPGAVFSDSTPS